MFSHQFYWPQQPKELGRLDYNMFISHIILHYAIMSSNSYNGLAVLLVLFRFTKRMFLLFNVIKMDSLRQKLTYHRRINIYADTLECPSLSLYLHCVFTKNREIVTTLFDIFAQKWKNNFVFTEIGLWVVISWKERWYW